MKQPFFAALGAALTCTTILASQAQPPQSGTGSDTPAIRQRLDVLRKTAGSEWIETFDFFCAVNPNRFNRADDPEIQPVPVFDNLAVMGRTSTAVWVVTTSGGLVLIDAGYGDQLDSVLLPGLKKLGLDPGLERRKPGEPNPFVVGRESYQRFLGVMSGCTEV